jgi:CRP-like cAMP-binding protein
MEWWQEKITEIFKSKVDLSKEECDALLLYWIHRISFKRNDLLIDKGQVETKLFFVVDGTMRIYFPNEAEEICVGFAYKNNLICSYPSFIKQEPSDYLIQALSKIELVAIVRQDFYSLFDRYPKIERAWRMLEEEALVGKIERETEMLTFTPEERYNRLLKRSPHIFQLIPRKYIASYLRMTPETLSRIRPS